MGTQAKMLWGYDQNGVERYAPVNLAANEIICPKCEGMGVVTVDYGRDGFQKLRIETCEHCDGDGTLEINTSEEDSQ